MEVREPSSSFAIQCAERRTGVYPRAMPEANARRRRSRRYRPRRRRNEAPPPDNSAIELPQSVLIADVGECAVRIARTCQRMGMKVLGLDAPRYCNDLHHSACDQLIEVAELEPETIAMAAVAHEAAALHPGYAHAGQAELAKECISRGLPFLGGGVDALNVSTDCLRSRELAWAAQVRTVPTFPSLVRTPEQASAAFDALKGPCRLRTPLATGPVSLATEDAQTAFQEIAEIARDREVPLEFIAEQALERPRILELTCLMDFTGNVAPLVEREHSLHWGHRLVLSESPSPALTVDSEGHARREALYDSAIRVLRGLGDTGLASVRFLIDIDGLAYFDQMELGLPESYSVTELVAGIDLVEWQLHLSSGGKITEDIETNQPSGHSAQAWIYGGTPSLAQVSEVFWPPVPQGSVRIEPETFVGDRWEADEMRLALRVATYGPVRHQALHTLDRIFAALRLTPLDTNIAALRRLLVDESFRFGQYDSSLDISQWFRTSQ